MLPSVLAHSIGSGQHFPLCAIPVCKLLFFSFFFYTNIAQHNPLFIAKKMAPLQQNKTKN